VNPTTPPIDWLALIAIAFSAAVMIYLFRRMTRGMNQQDWILLRQARARGINPAEPQSVDFVLFLASAEAADLVIEELRKEAYEASKKQAQIQYARTRKKPGEPQGGFLVTGRKTLALYPAELAKVRLRLTEIAAAQKGIYCGWQVAAASQQQQQAQQ
jgi:hypothetical protein